MSYVLIRHKVADYAAWKPFYDGDAAVRAAAGARGARVFRNATDPSEVVILFEWETLEGAQAFTQNPALPAVMQQAGVIDHPDIYFLEEEASNSH